VIDDRDWGCDGVEQVKEEENRMKRKEESPLQASFYSRTGRVLKYIQLPQPTDAAAS
jgi:hypothetical protein